MASLGKNKLNIASVLLAVFTLANPAHSQQARAIGLVIDDTGSMRGEIDAVQTALSDYIGSRNPSIPTTWQLTTFKDSVSDYGVTTDTAVVTDWVNSLEVSGGGDCPEDALGGISTSIATLQDYPEGIKSIIVATDASTQGGDVDAIISAAIDSRIRINVLLTGDCVSAGGFFTGFTIGSLGSSPKDDGVLTKFKTILAALSPISSAQAEFLPGPLSSRVVLKRMAEETGGFYYYLPGGSSSDYALALDEIFATVDEPPVPVDDTAPAVDVTAGPAIIWPPNHKMVELDVAVLALDDIDDSPLVELVGVTSTEPADGQGDGSTANDITITDDGRIFVRAERSGSGNMRIYTVTYKATDASGNFDYGSAEVVVPHNNRGGSKKNR